MEAAVAMSLKLNIPKIIIGMTVVSFATSAPELIVSIKAALLGHPDLALGNVLGSNVANFAFVLGIVILIAPIGVAKNFYKLDNAKNLEMITRVFFNQRRKMLKNPFNQIFKNPKEISDKLNIDLNLRPQNLEIETYFNLVKAIKNVEYCLP